MRTPQFVRVTGLFSAALLLSSTPAVAHSEPQPQPPNTLDWTSCPEDPPSRDGKPLDLKCATLTVPMNHRGGDATTTVQVGRIQAADPAQRRGAVIVNTGELGSGLSSDAQEAADRLPSSIRQHFDIYALDNRGLEYSTPVACFTSAAEQEERINALSVIRPSSRGAQATFRFSSEDLATGCATNAEDISQSLSSATWAHDVDTLREALGEEKINLLGLDAFGYPVQVYANIFPNRVRTAVVDGVLDGQLVAGTGRFAGQNLGQRTGMITAKSDALKEIYRLCEAAGPTKCLSATDHDEHKTPSHKLAHALDVAKTTGLHRTTTYKEVTKDGKVLRTIPIRLSTSYDEAIEQLDAQMTARTVDPMVVDSLIHGWWKTSIGKGDLVVEFPAREGDNDGEDQFAASVHALTALNDPAARKNSADSNVQYSTYEHAWDTAMAMTCNDSRHPRTLGGAFRQAEKSARLSTEFGEATTWRSVPCSAWAPSGRAAHDSFRARTENPILFVNSTHSGTFLHDNAKRAVNRYPNAALLEHYSWQNTSVGNSDCVDEIVSSYVLDAKKPANLRCDSPEIPFQDEVASDNLAGHALEIGHLNPDNLQALLANLPANRVVAKPALQQRYQR